MSDAGSGIESGGNWVITDLRLLLMEGTPVAVLEDLKLVFSISVVEL